MLPTDITNDTSANSTRDSLHPSDFQIFSNSSVKNAAWTSKLMKSHFYKWHNYQFKDNWKHDILLAWNGLARSKGHADMSYSASQIQHSRCSTMQRIGNSVLHDAIECSDARRYSKKTSGYVGKQITLGHVRSNHLKGVQQAHHKNRLVSAGAPYHHIYGFWHIELIIRPWSRPVPYRTSLSLLPNFNQIFFDAASLHATLGHSDPKRGFQKICGT